MFDDDQPQVQINDSADEEGTSINLMIIGIIGGSIVVVAVIVVAIYLATKAKSSEKIDGQQFDENNMELFS